MIEKLKERWGLNSKWQILIILLVFTITGSSATKLAGPIIEFVGLQKESTNVFLYWTLRIFMIFPIYQILLVSFGWLFGQFTFFWNFEKKMLTRLGLAKFLK